MLFRSDLGELNFNLYRKSDTALYSEEYCKFLTDTSSSYNIYISEERVVSIEALDTSCGDGIILKVMSDEELMTHTFRFTRMTGAF